MPRFHLSSRVPASAAELFAWHARPGAFERLVPPWQRIEVVKPAERLEDGSRVTLRLRKGPLAVRWVAEHRRVRPGTGFVDVQVAGPFARWEHAHDFEDNGDGSATLRDTIRYALPGGALGALVGGRTVAGDLDRTFRYRHATTAADLRLHGRFRGRPRLTVAMTGASGLIGRTLTALLRTGGHRVVPLLRRASAGTGQGGAFWHPAVGLLEPEALSGVDALVHLAGENIAGGRWSEERKRRIRDSRVEGTRNLLASLARLDRAPRVVVCASAVGFYGNRGSDEADESAAPGSGFLAAVVRDWEQEAARAAELGARAVQLRFGVVLSPRGGALAKMLPAFRAGLGGPVGDGRQALSWISVDDAAAAVLHTLYDHGLEGPVNAAAPAPVTNEEFTRVLGRVLRRPAVLPLPAFAARALFGEMAEETLLGGVRAVPARLAKRGFQFRHAEVEAALRHLLGREPRS